MVSLEVPCGPHSAQLPAEGSSIWLTSNEAPGSFYRPPTASYFWMLPPKQAALWDGDPHRWLKACCPPNVLLSQRKCALPCLAKLGK